MTKRLIVGAVSIAVAACALLATGTAGYAYPTPVGSAKLVSGCAVVPPGGNCDYTFQFVDAAGTPSPNLPVVFMAKGVKRCTVSPHAGTTDAGGMVSTTLICAAKSGTGTITLTAKSGKVSASADVTIAAPAAEAGAHLPFSNAASPSGAGSATPWALVGGLLAAVLLASLSLARYLALRARGGRRP